MTTEKITWKKYCKDAHSKIIDVIKENDLHPEGCYIKSAPDTDVELRIKYEAEGVLFFWVSRLLMYLYLEVYQRLPDGFEYLFNSKKSRNDNPRETFICQCNQLNKILPDCFSISTTSLNLLLPFDFESNFYKAIDEVINDYKHSSSNAIGNVFGNFLQALHSGEKKGSNNVEKNDSTYQIYTPEWVAEYLVQNALGRIIGLCQAKKSSLSENSFKAPDLFSDEIKRQLITKWAYFIPNAEQDVNIIEKNAVLDSEIPCELEKIQILEPCMGSGNILCVLFDRLFELYEIKGGFSKEKIAENIICKNLYGLELDEFSTSVSIFVMAMKAYDVTGVFPSYLSAHNLYTMLDSSCITEDVYHAVPVEYHEILNILKNEFKDTINLGLGSLTETKCSEHELRILKDILKPEFLKNHNLLPIIAKFVNQALILSHKYEIVITNPPYRGSKKINEEKRYIYKKKYKKSHSNLALMFMERCSKLCAKHGYISLITAAQWTTNENDGKFRMDFVENNSIFLIGIGNKKLFKGCNVATTAIVYKNTGIDNLKTLIIPDLRQTVNEIIFLERNILHQIKNYPKNKFVLFSNEFLANINNKGYMLELGISKTGISIGGQHDVMLRWWEVEKNKIFRRGKEYKDIENITLNWFPYSHIPNPSHYGVWRWYENSLLILNFPELKNRNDKKNESSISIPQEQNFYFKKSIAWPLNYQERFTARTIPEGTLFANKAPSFFPNNSEDFYSILGYFNSALIEEFLHGANLSNNITNGVSHSFPLLSPDSQEGQKIGKYAKENEFIVKRIWDELEVSMDYVGNPLWLGRDNKKSLIEIYNEWNEECIKRAKKIKANEKKIDRLVNKYFDVDIKRDRSEDESGFIVRTREETVKELISFAIGGMFGRYSELNIKRLDDRFLLATKESNNLANDLVKNLIQFIGDQFGNNEENIEFIADSLRKTKLVFDPEDVIREYLFNNFLDDNNKKFENAPIYLGITRSQSEKRKWIALIYIHDWNKKDFVSRFFEEIVPNLIDEFKRTTYNEEIKFLEGLGCVNYATSPDNYYIDEYGVQKNCTKINGLLKKYGLELLPKNKNKKEQKI